MEHASYDRSRLESMQAQLEELDSTCASLKKQLSLARDRSVEIKFQLNALDHPGFFQKHFGSLRKKKDALWQTYRAAVSAQDQIQMDYDAQSALRTALLAEYQALLSSQKAAP